MKFESPDVHLVLDVYTSAIRLIDTAGCFTTQALHDDVAIAATGWSEGDTLQALDHLATRALLTSSAAPGVDTGDGNVDVWFAGHLYPRKET